MSSKPSPLQSNPYRLEAPAAVAFSGGRTSGYMLWKVLQAFDGTLPDGVVVSFQNTGLEHPATYTFVNEVAQRWGVNIVWLEYTYEDSHIGFRVTDFENASRAGEPFSALLREKQFLPNPRIRFCTQELKIRTLDRYLAGLPAFSDGWTAAIGLRADEPRRAMSLKSDNPLREPTVPLYRDGQTEQDVLRFWREQPFDLDLPLTGNMAGNCVGCFLKSRGKIEHLMREMPEHFEWWLAAEANSPQRKDMKPCFRNDRPSYEQLMRTVNEQGYLFDYGDDDTIPCMCTD
jgi:hypothetical protein